MAGDNGQEDSLPKSADLPFYSQRLYSKRLKANRIAKARLKSTAWTLLDSDAQAVILSAVETELRVRIEIMMRTMAPREKIPYDKLAEVVISKVFYDHLNLFVFGDEDPSTVDELMNYEDSRERIRHLVAIRGIRLEESR